MTEFDRDFSVPSAAALNKPENAWFIDLLRYWQPAGDSVCTHPSCVVDKPPSYRLRLAIRNGYLNFYRAGRSIAKVEFNGTNLQATIHEKYVLVPGGRDKKYVTVTAGSFSGIGERRIEYGEEYLRSWILNANNHGKSSTVGEKVFVDEFIAHKPNVIDVEAGLPADPLFKNTGAPRMDVVEIERDGDRWKIVVREAKLVTNGEARRRLGLPFVVENQLKPYTRWLESKQERVRKSYQRTCARLVELHRLAKSFNQDIAGLGTGISAVAGIDWTDLLLECQPRLLMYCGTDDRGFCKNEHKRKLEDAGYKVELIYDADLAELRARA